MKNITPYVDSRLVVDIIRRDPFLWARVRKLADRRGVTVSRFVAAVCRKALGRLGNRPKCGQTNKANICS